MKIPKRSFYIFPMDGTRWKNHEGTVGESMEHVQRCEEEETRLV